MSAKSVSPPWSGTSMAWTIVGVRRHVFISHVLVPERGAVIDADGLSIPEDVRERQDLGHLRVAQVFQDMRLGTAELLRKSQELLRRWILIADHHKLVLVEKPAQLDHVRIDDVDARHLDPKLSVRGCTSMASLLN